MTATEAAEDAALFTAEEAESEEDDDNKNSVCPKAYNFCETRSTSAKFDLHNVLITF